MRVYIIAVHSLINIESLSSACVKSLELAEVSFILFVRLCDCNNVAPILLFEASCAALSYPVRSTKTCFKICKLSAT